MPRFSQPRVRLRSMLIGGIAAVLTTATVAIATVSPAQADNRVTPGNFTGYGFDQCVAPTQATMDKWMAHSPFSAVGIYISGDSRACRSQPNLTPTWIATQLANRWRLLPITLGPQAACLSRFPRYGNDPTINPRTTKDYKAAKTQGRREAEKAVAAAARLGIAPASTLWYDLEGFDVNNTTCRESAIRFLHGWTNRLHKLGYVSGVYSSAASGIKMLDDARVKRPGQFSLPDHIWIARWDGIANLSTTYISDRGWQPHRRVKQFRGGHNETWGGATINIDSNFMSLGSGSTFRRMGLSCGGRANLNRASFPKLTPQNASRSASAVSALQCLLKKRDYYSGQVSGQLDAETVAAMNTFQRETGTKVYDSWNRRQWIMLLSTGNYRMVKRGLSGTVVRRLQRALSAATKNTVPVTGVFDQRTEQVTKIWQQKVGLAPSGVMTTAAWSRLRSGTFR